MKIALVTGASRGIGLAVADALRAAPGEGMHVVRLARTLRNASAEGRTDITFTVPQDDVERAQPALDELAKKIGAAGVTFDREIATSTNSPRT